MGSQLQACITMQSAFRSILKKNGGEEGDKHNDNAMKSNTQCAVNNGSMLSIRRFIHAY